MPPAAPGTLSTPRATTAMNVSLSSIQPGCAWFIPLHLTPSPRQPYTESVEEAAHKEWFERPCTLESKKVMKCEIRQREKTLEANFIFTLRPQLII